MQEIVSNAHIQVQFNQETKDKNRLQHTENSIEFIINAFF